MTTVQGSMRQQLLIRLLIGFAAIWLIAGTISLLQLREQVRRLLDVNLQQSAMPLLHEIEEAYPEHAFSLFRYSSNVIFQIWGDGDKLQLHSKNAPLQHLSNHFDGFSDSEIADAEWRVFSVWDNNHRYLVQVGELKQERRFFAQKLLQPLLRSLLLAVPLFAAMIWLVVGRALRPMAQLRDEVARRDSQFLAPIQTAVPREIAPLVERLNELLARMQTSLDSERRFTGDAAHELRTPLAALKSQIQVALAATDQQQQRHALENALLACDSATHRVEQMLTLARLDHEVWQQESESIDLHEAAAQAIVEAAPFAASKHIALSLDGSVGATIRARAGLWSILLRNLLDNAIRYAPENTQVNVRIVTSANAVELAVADEGPGIPADQLPSALERFNRLGHSEHAGTGLGLSIVARIAELHGATLELAAGQAGTGLVVRVRVPR